MAFDPETLSGLTNVNDDVFFNQDVTFYGRVNLDKVAISGDTVEFPKDIEFTGGDITVKRLNATDIITQTITAGISTFQDIYINGKLYDGDGDFGSAGQVLSSDGTNLNWINTSDANVGSATNVGTNEDGTNADQYVTFVSAKTGNNPIRVDEGIKYNPSTNTLTVGTIAASTFSGLPDTFPVGGIILWSGATDAVPNGWALCDGQNNTPDLRDRFVVGAGNAYSVDETGGADSVTLTEAQMPSHTHLTARNQTGTATAFPTGAGFMVTGNNGNPSSSTGGDQPHENRPPYYALAYIMKT